MEVCTDAKLPPSGTRAGGRSAMVLGATLALGGCSLGGCGDDADLEPKMPSLESSSHLSSLDAEEDEEGDGEALAMPDVEAEEGRLGTIEASPGFVPDPLTHSGETAGGPVDAHEFDDRCAGWIAGQPDVILRTPRPFAELSVMVASAEDTSLMVVGPDGEPRCGDDEDGTLPVVRGAFAAGDYRVWVGVARRGSSVPFSLALSELEGSTPSSLVQ